MPEIPFYPGADQPANQPNHHETPHASGEDTKRENNGFFQNLREKIKQARAKNRLPKPLKLNPFDPERSNRLTPMNRIIDLPAEYQYYALRLIYDEADRKGHPDSSLEKIIGPNMQRIEADQFACSVETDSILQPIARATLESRVDIFKESLQIQKGIISIGKPYESIDTTLFSPQVAQSRDVCLNILQVLSPYPGQTIRSFLVEFDKSGYSFPRPERGPGLHF